MSKGFTLIAASLHHNLAGHFWVNGTEVGKSSRLGKRVRKLFVSIHHFGFEHLVRTRHRVGNIVAIRPCDGGSHRHRQLRRSETEVVDFHFDRSWLLLCAGREISCSGAQPCNSQPQHRQQKCSRHTSPHVSSPFLFALRLLRTLVCV